MNMNRPAFTSLLLAAIAIAVFAHPAYEPHSAFHLQGISPDQFLSTPITVPFVDDDGAWCDVAVVDGLTWSYAVVGAGNNETARVGVFAKIRAVPASTSGHVEIPSSFEGVPVTAIDAMAFYGCEGIESIVIPEGVGVIGDYAFYGCSSLAVVSLPLSITNIGANAFGACPLLATDSVATPFTRSDSLESHVDDSSFATVLRSKTLPQPFPRVYANSQPAVCVVLFDANGGTVDTA